MTSRRSVLALGSLMPFLAGLRNGCEAKSPSQSDTLYQRLGVRPVINAGEPYTSMGGAPIRPEARAAMEAVSEIKARLDEVHDAVGKRLATLLKCPAAMVTSGAAGALTVGVAGCITGDDQEKIARLPRLQAGDRSEVIIQKTHRYDYEHAVRNCGVRMVEVETLAQLRDAISPRTACLLFNNRWSNEGAIGHEEFVRIGKTVQVPTFIDCASDAPPASNLLKYQSIGFDLVTFSGGKGLRGPSSTGLLFGRADLVAAARKNSSPHDDAIGRGMKIGHEELVGILVVVELLLEDKVDPLLEASVVRLQRIQSALSRPGIAVTMFEPPVSYQSPHLRVSWDEKRSGITADSIRTELKATEPRIYTRTGPDEVVGIELTAWMLSDDEERQLIRRLQSALSRIS
jgi:D-glucosaminate-6-phosphate ammonia-lyase